LEKAQNWSLPAVPPFLNELQDLKRNWLKRLSPAPVFRVEKPRDIVIDLIKETIDCLRKRELHDTDKKTAALAELLLEMENNPAGIMHTISDYSFAFAATCQQSVNIMMQKMKGISPTSSKSMEYDYVIVDEAARVGPRDLMIPMAQGKRIILVGDHRQLPQLIDKEVAARIEADNASADEENKWLEKSMFEYLFTERLGKLEEKDDIRRCVTLDKQYRMHPILGDFISRNFYKRFNEIEEFGSGRPKSDFKQDLPGAKGKCAVWLDVPQIKGRMKMEGNSWTRPAEAEIICKKLKEWMECEAGKDLSFGVISFYKAQTELIQKQLGDKYIDTAGDRLRIGTVDSFQGMEFDVVFLSLVRTNGFGFLQIYNRLNVSMSRQKKLLAAVGDAAFFDTREAWLKVRGLADFLQLCRTEDGVVL
jgi:superfamily I DNA and/or RNA helicase